MNSLWPRWYILLHQEKIDASIAKTCRCSLCYFICLLIFLSSQVRGLHLNMLITGLPLRSPFDYLKAKLLFTLVRHFMFIKGRRPFSWPSEEVVCCFERNLWLTLWSTGGFCYKHIQVIPRRNQKCGCAGNSSAKIRAYYGVQELHQAPD